MTWSYFASETVQGTAEQVWAIWTKVDGWNTWDIDMAKAHLYDAAAGFVTGAKGSATMTFGTTADFVLEDVVPNERFSYSVKVPLATLNFTFEMKPSESVTSAVQIKHGAVYTGAFGGLYGWWFKDMTVKGLDAAVKNIKSLVENPTAPPPHSSTSKTASGH